MRFFSIFTLLLLQGLIFSFTHALCWQLGIVARKSRNLLLIILIIIGNGLLLGALLGHVNVLFRLSALLLVLLWYTLMVSLVVYVLYMLGARFRQPESVTRILRRISPILLISLIIYSFYNAYTPVVRHVSFTINKPLAHPVRIGMAADLHLGVLVGTRQLDKLSEMMQRENVDIILLPGDIMDDNTFAYDAEQMQPHLQKLRAPLGVYATLGNHDLFGHEREITRAIQAAGIHVLHDNAVKINDFWLIGRPDKLDKHRQTTMQLMRQVNPHEAVFLMDHRPDDVLTHSTLPIDVQVSGHVHNGQIFPANFVVRQLNRLAYGYEAIGKGHFVVTSGFGFWGIPFRLGSQSEIWVIDVHGTQTHQTAEYIKRK